MAEKRQARKAYQINPNRENFELFLEAEGKTREVLRKQKKSSFRDLCASITPKMGTGQVWSLIRAFSGKKSSPLNTSNDPESPEYKALRNEIVREDIVRLPVKYLKILIHVFFRIDFRGFQPW